MVKKRSEEEGEVLRRFGERLRELRLAQHITQEELAAAADFSRSYYNEIETGKRNISLLNLHKLARTLKIALNQLLDI